MISYIYKCRREQIAVSECLSECSKYATIMDVALEGNIFGIMHASINHLESYDEILTSLREYLRSIFENITIVKNSISSVSYMDIAGKKLCTEALKISFAQNHSAKMYLANYIFWMYSTYGAMLDVILTNGSISNIDLVGPRTLDYIKELGLSEVEGRFKTPSNYLATPLIFKYPNLNLFGPPMTTATYSKTTISSVYHALGIDDISYFKCGKTAIARPSIPIQVMNSINFFITLASKMTGQVSAKDLKRDFLYDLFLYKSILSISNLSVNCDNIVNDFNLMFEDGGIGELPQYLKNIKIDSALSMPTLVGLIY